MHANYDLTPASPLLSSRISAQWQSRLFTFHYVVRRKSGIGQRKTSLLELDCLNARVRLLKEPARVAAQYNPDEVAALPVVVEYPFLSIKTTEKAEDSKIRITFEGYGVPKNSKNKQSLIFTSDETRDSCFEAIQAFIVVGTPAAELFQASPADVNGIVNPLQLKGAACVLNGLALDMHQQASTAVSRQSVMEPERPQSSRLLRAESTRRNLMTELDDASTATTTSGADEMDTSPLNFRTFLLRLYDGVVKMDRIVPTVSQPQLALSASLSPALSPVSSPRPGIQPAIPPHSQCQGAGLSLSDFSMEGKDTDDPFFLESNFRESLSKIVKCRDCQLWLHNALKRPFLSLLPSEQFFCKRYLASRIHPSTGLDSKGVFAMTNFRIIYRACQHSVTSLTSPFKVHRHVSSAVQFAADIPILLIDKISTTPDAIIRFDLADSRMVLIGFDAPPAAIEKLCSKIAQLRASYSHDPKKSFAFQSYEHTRSDLLTPRPDRKSSGIFAYNPLREYQRLGLAPASNSMSSLPPSPAAGLGSGSSRRGHLKSTPRSVTFQGELSGVAPAPCDWRLVVNRSASFSSSSSSSSSVSSSGSSALLTPGRSSNSLSADVDFGICPTYPAVFVVPAAYSDKALQQYADFRHGKRLPVAVWRHAGTKATLCRSGCLAAATGSTSSPDDQASAKWRKLKLKRLLAMIRALNPTESRTLYIAATSRLPRSEEKCDVSSGFDGCQLLLRGTDDAAQVQTALSALQILCAQFSFNSLAIGNEVSIPLPHNPASLELLQEPNVEAAAAAWWSRLEATKWLQGVRSLLCDAVRICDALDLEGISVLVHDSRGWDRQAQLSALSQLMLDPFYRTLDGFCVLIEKEWFSFGHSFRAPFNNNDEQMSLLSPTTGLSSVFLQWLDAVWQLWRQFPTDFEFDELLLVELIEQSASGQIGSFLFSTDAERAAARCSKHAMSLWTLLLTEERRRAYLNPLYVLRSSLVPSRPSQTLSGQRTLAPTSVRDSSSTTTSPLSSPRASVISLPSSPETPTAAATPAVAEVVSPLAAAASAIISSAAASPRRSSSHHSSSKRPSRLTPDVSSHAVHFWSGGHLRHERSAQLKAFDRLQIADAFKHYLERITPQLELVAEAHRERAKLVNVQAAHAQERTARMQAETAASELRSRLGALQAELDALTASHDELNRVHTDAQLKIATHEAMKDTLRQLRIELHEKNLNLAQANNDRDAAQAQIAELKTSLDDASRRIVNYKLSLSDINNDLVASRLAHEERKLVIMRLEKELKAYKQDADGADGDTARTDRGDLDERIESLKTARKHLADSLSATQKELAAVQNDRLLLQTELNDARTRIAMLGASADKGWSAPSSAISSRDDARGSTLSVVQSLQSQLAEAEAARLSALAELKALRLRDSISEELRVALLDKKGDAPSTLPSETAGTETEAADLEPGGLAAENQTLRAELAKLLGELNTIKTDVGLSQQPPQQSPHVPEQVGAVAVSSLSSPSAEASAVVAVVPIAKHRELELECARLADELALTKAKQAQLEEAAVHRELEVRQLRADAKAAAEAERLSAAQSNAPTLNASLCRWQYQTPNDDTSPVLFVIALTETGLGAQAQRRRVEWTVLRRFSDFVKFADYLKKRRHNKIVSSVALPPKKIGALSKDQIEQRLSALAAWLDPISDQLLHDSVDQEVDDFFEISANINRGGAAKR